MAHERDLAHEADLEMRRREHLRSDIDPDNGDDWPEADDPDLDPWPDTGLDGDDS